jgi:hypothetical protein
MHLRLLLLLTALRIEADAMEYYKTNMDSDSMYYVGRRKGVVSEAATVPSR